MCGIVGVVSLSPESAGLALSCLENLEYRGYDSAGIASLGKEGITVVKSKGSVSELVRLKGASTLQGFAFIAHTRWATHGPPTDYNAHPHSDCSGSIAVVHNGIISNYEELRERLRASGHTFKSDTDTEVIPHLIEEGLREGTNPFEAFKEAVAKLEGYYAILALVSGERRILFAKRGNPLVVGLGEGKNFVASDIPAFLKFTRRVIVLQDGQLGFLTHNSVYVESNGSPVPLRVEEVPYDRDAISLAGFQNYMLKEIHESPRAVRETILWFSSNRKVVKEVVNYMSSSRLTLLLAAGTSFHASLLFSTLMRKEGFRVEAVISSEHYAYPKADLIIAVSQSGETMDTLAALRKFKTRGARVVSLTNVMETAISRESDLRLYTRAGPEVSVAATKTFTSQLAALYFLYYLSVGKDPSLLRSAAEVVEVGIQAEGLAKEFGEDLAKRRSVYFLGRGVGVPLSMEGALKMKEVSYVHAEAYPAGESKHGPISLVEKGFPVVFLDEGEQLEGVPKSKLLADNVSEMRARGASIFLLGYNSDLRGEKSINLRGEEDLGPFALAPVIQLIAYYAARSTGLNPDRPRNLAKTVTVQ
jgi:glucosamine--fructose-6-phosphate aminotransferase (isomerizing)